MRQLETVGRDFFRQIQLPHYVNYAKRSDVIYAYRQLQRLVGKWPIAADRRWLRDECFQRFAAFKYETRPEKIHELLKVAYQNITVLEKAVVKWDAHAFDNTHAGAMNLVYRQMYVKQRPMWKFARQYGAIGPDVVRDIAFRVNQLKAPSAGTLGQYEQGVHNARQQQGNPTQEVLFYRFAAMVQNARVNEGKRKLVREPRVEGTFLGGALPESRQKTAVRRFYKDLLRNMWRPVSPHVWNRLESCLDLEKIPGTPDHKQNFMKRRIQMFLFRTYTVQELDDGALFMVHYRPGAWRELLPDSTISDQKMFVST